MEIIIDTREQKDLFLFKSFQVKTKVKKLDTGDYSITGFEKRITIDRKRDANELQMCYGQNWKRFERMLQRMLLFEEAYILCTFPEYHLETFPQHSNIPKYRWKYLKTSAAYLRYKTKKIQEDFPNIKIIFGNSHYESEEVAYNLLKTYHDKHKKH
jgi:hypothetical protein